MKVLYDIKDKDEFGRVKEIYITSYSDEEYKKFGFKKTFGFESDTEKYRVVGTRYINPVHDEKQTKLGLEPIREMTYQEQLDSGLIKPEPENMI